MQNLLISLCSIVRDVSTAPKEREAAMAVEWGLTTGRFKVAVEDMILGLSRDDLDRLIAEMASWRVAMDQMVRRLNGQAWEVTA